MLAEFESRGVWFTIAGPNKVEAHFPEKFPVDLERVILENCEEIKAAVFERERKLRKTMRGVIRRLQMVPVVYLNSQGLGEEIAFCRDGEEWRVRHGVVTYTLSEIKPIAGASCEVWRMINAAKKTFGGRIYTRKDEEKCLKLNKL